MNSNLTITRKRLEAIAYGSVRQSQEEGIELARMALTTIDSEMPVQDYFSLLVSAARVRADKAMRKYPQPNYVLNKVAEEHGEVIKAVIHYTEGREKWSNVESEIIDNLAMLLRLVIEGDQVIGFTPPDARHNGISSADNDMAHQNRVFSIRHKSYSRLDDFETSARSWLDATPQPADRQTSSLVMWVKRLSLSLRSVSPDNKLPKAAMGYLRNNGLISIADCLRGNNEEPPA
ncbi:hypothetical protein [Klebsiella michiganensis]|uniref:hypothetical protein n=1 Tax=Klebsiella michiganensis TaxID=1134687 RepID=UPI0025966781|nr:hypothetical protein [Klebsiella michiganensis]MDM4471346.1 hypothetical protein [Klebsiella michiganensis]